MLKKPSDILEFRTIWISDIPLGTRGCKARELLQFLKYARSDKLFLGGNGATMDQLKADYPTVTFFGMKDKGRTAFLLQ